MLRLRKPRSGSSPPTGPRDVVDGRSRDRTSPSLSRYCSRLSSDGTSTCFDLQGQRQRPRADVERRGVRPRGRRVGVEGPAEPAGVEGAGLGPGRLPDLHRPEVRAVGVRVSHPLDDRQPARLRAASPSPPMLGWRPISFVILWSPPGASRRARRPSRVAVHPVRHDRVQPVVAAEELDHDEDAVVRLRSAPRPTGRSAEEGREPRAAEARSETRGARRSCGRTRGKSRRWDRIEERCARRRAASRATPSARPRLYVPSGGYFNLPATSTCVISIARVFWAPSIPKDSP